MAIAKPRSKSAQKSKTVTKAVKYIQYMTMRPATLFLLNFFSFGMYELNWHYRNWNAIRANTREVMTPVSRALFAIFFVNRLFTQVSQSARSKRYRKLHDPSGLAIIYAASFIVMAYLIKLMVLTPTTHFGKSFYLGVAILFVLAARSLVLAIVQKGMNHYMNAIKQYAKPAGFSIGDVAFPLAGLALFAAIFAGLFMSNSFVNQNSLRQYATRAAVHAAAAAKTQAPATPKAPATVNQFGSTSANGAVGAGAANPTAHDVMKDNVTSTAKKPSLNDGWKVYENKDFKFSISYPSISRYPMNWSTDEQTVNGKLSTLNFLAPNGQRYPEVARLEVRSGNLASSTSFYDNYFAGSKETVNSKSNVTVNGRKATLYSTTSASGVRTDTYLVDAGNKRTIVINSVHGDLNEKRFTDFWGTFSQFVNSLTIR